MNNIGKYRIQIFVMNENVNKVLSLYESEDFDGLDAFELQKLLGNICNRIIMNYKRDLQSEEKDIISLEMIKLTNEKKKVKVISTLNQ